MSERPTSNKPAPLWKSLLRTGLPLEHETALFVTMSLYAMANVLTSLRVGPRARRVAGAINRALRVSARVAAGPGRSGAFGRSWARSSAARCA